MSAPLRQSTTVVADSSGNAEAVLGPPQGGYQWTVGSLTVSTSAGTPCPCEVYLNAAVPQGLICRSAQGQGDTAAGSPPVVLQPGDQLVVVWSAAGAGASCTAVATGTIDPLTTAPAPSRPLLG